jgi:hypothetical protein
MTAQINRSQIFKNAWNFVKTLALSISEALKQAWAEAKAPATVATHTVILDTKGYDVAIVNGFITIEGVEYKVETVEYNMYDRFARTNAGKQYIMYKSDRTMLEPIAEYQARVAEMLNPSNPTVVSSTRVWNESEGCYGDLLEYSNGKKKLVLDY